MKGGYQNDKRTDRNTKVLSKCKSKGIEVYTLKKSKANTIAFTSNYRRRREFEITLLKDSKYRISTRFLGYKKAMMERSNSVFEDNDPDGRRKRFNVDLHDEATVNRMIWNMLEHGFSELPVTQHR